MKIGIDISFILRDNRGMGRYVRGMLKSLFANHSDNEFLLAHRGGEASLIADFIANSGAGERVEMQELSQCNRSNVDVFWYPWNRVDVVPESGAVAVTIHDIAPVRFTQKSIWNALDTRRTEARMRNAIRRADLVMTVSSASAAEIRSFEPGLKTRISVVYPGLDFTFDAARGYVGRVVKDEYLLFVGADDERKNLPRLIEAYVLLLKDKSIEHKLVLCGLGSSANRKYREMLRKAGLGDKVILLDYVSDQDLCGLYAGASALVFPSLYEGFGFPVLEAMACGTPVVCSNASSLPEVANDAALLCDPENPADIAEKTARCLKNALLRGELIQRGLSRAQNFTWERSASELVSALENLMEGRR